MAARKILIAYVTFISGLLCISFGQLWSRLQNTVENSHTCLFKCKLKLNKIQNCVPKVH